MDQQKTVLVYQVWDHKVPALIGRLYIDIIKGREHYSFAYDEAWLTAFGSSTLMLDPDLALYSGRQHVPVNKKMFGIFADSCPDRWGRLLMKRREAITAHKESRKPRALMESDFLLGVYDGARIGALRFATQENGPFLSDDTALATPPWVTLRTLESASLAFENDESGMNEKWLNQLLAPGSSLGGARPKATVMAPNGSLWIAKFPSKHDEYNSGAWEKVVHDLAGLCGLNIPDSKLETFSNTGSTFLVKRFDRNGERRIHFSSAMTLLGRTDGDEAADGCGYPELASFIKAYGAQPRKDLLELWKRIVFNMAVSNTDDHLRNHGFILTESGWRLSPLYDVNPNIYGDRLSLNVDRNDNTISFELAQSTSKLYGINEADAAKIICDIKKTVKDNWENLAIKYNLSRNARQYMEPAFMECYRNNFL